MTTPPTRPTHWDGWYRTVGAGRVSWHEAEPRKSLEFLDVVGANAESSIIDIGGGASSLAQALVRGSYQDVSVLDVSEEALRLARRGLDSPDSVQWIRTDLVSWVLPRRWALWQKVGG